MLFFPPTSPSKTLSLPFLRARRGIMSSLYFHLHPHQSIPHQKAGKGAIAKKGNYCCIPLRGESRLCVLSSFLLSMCDNSGEATSLLPPLPLSSVNSSSPPFSSSRQKLPTSPYFPFSFRHSLLFRPHLLPNLHFPNSSRGQLLDGRHTHPHFPISFLNSSPICIESET